MDKILWALAGSSMGAIGMVCQKKGIRWMDMRKSKQAGLSKYFFIWLAGILTSYVLSAYPNSIASNALPPHIITAMAGWEIVVIVFLSWVFLKERMYKTDGLYALLIVGCTAVLGVRTRPAEYMQEQKLWRILVFLIPVVFLFPLLNKRLTAKTKVAFFAIYSGCMGGLALVYFNILVRAIFAHGLKGLPIGILALYLLSAVLGLIGEQTSYRIGEMTVVASIRLSLYIVYPIFCSMLLYKSSIDVIQLMAIAVIIFACYGIYRKR